VGAGAASVMSLGSAVLGSTRTACTSRALRSRTRSMRHVDPSGRDTISPAPKYRIDGGSEK
jgi:hypothetical protein